jgi:putative iron-dependent peroxidase
MFISCATSHQPFESLLHSRIFGDENGDYDRLLDFTNAETGAAFFAPPIGFILDKASSKKIDVSSY